MKKQTTQKQRIQNREYLTEDFLNDGRGIYERERDYIDARDEIIRDYRDRIAAWNY